MRGVLLIALVQFYVVQANRNGRLLATSWADPDRGTAGEVYVINSNTFFLKNFHFGDNGAGVPPDGHFVVGKTRYSTIKSSSNGSDPTGVILADEVGRMLPLEVYSGKDIYISLPAGENITEYKYLAIWCRQYAVYFGAVEIPDNFQPPAPTTIGRFSRFAHNVKSGDVIILDTRTILVKNFFYDGQGPDAFWYIGNRSDVGRHVSPFGKIPDENGSEDDFIPDFDATFVRKAVMPDSLQAPGAYRGTDVTLTLPDGLTIYDIRWLSFYCVSFRVDFGSIFFDTPDFYVPVSLQGEQADGPMNCEVMTEDLQVSWKVMDDKIKFKLAGRIDRTRYMAFGLSGSNSFSRMVGSDVTVADWLEFSTPRAIDYQLTAYSQCANGQGACPDTLLTSPGQDNALMPSAEIEDGILAITYYRALNTNDVSDQIYLINGTNQQIVWAIGPINTQGTVAKHESRIRTYTSFNFGRTVVNNCPSFDSQEPEIEKPDFLPHHIYGDYINFFRAEIGQAGLSQGYQALTGNPSWSIAWYINGILVPELHLIRGKSYTFWVNGGDDSTIGSQYHPLYITDDEFGGYQEFQRGTIYPGTVNGTLVNLATGPYCEWESTPEYIAKLADGDYPQCFEEFKYNLELSCPFNMENTEFVWTPNDDTPDTVFYQCYTHQNLGWKIHVYDEVQFPSTKIADRPCSFASTPAPTTTATTTEAVWAMKLRLKMLYDCCKGWTSCSETMRSNCV